jgi:DNA repair protein RadA/Sms
MSPPGKDRTLFVCRHCGFTAAKWLGRCPECGEWDSLVKEQQPDRSRSSGDAAPALPLIHASRPALTRLITGISELDRVLGGGIVPGSVILVGGDPGIGKSTLILQLLSALAENSRRVLYVTGEESAEQIRLRADRLAIGQEQIFLATENRVESIVDMAGELKPALLAVDSIQTMYTEEAASAPGGVTQVRESAAKLLALAKGSGLPIILIGHVTKDGAIAGPRVLEHMVDTVLYFEGDRGQVFRILRTVKNRFGSTNEIGVFEMKETGLAEVENPSALFPRRAAGERTRFGGPAQHRGNQADSG